LSQIGYQSAKKLLFDSIENLSTRAVASIKDGINISNDLEVKRKNFDRRLSMDNKTPLSMAGLVVSNT
jgi:hypothetical protein